MAPLEEAAMDWNAAIERNREALKRVLAVLVAMAGLGRGDLVLHGRGGRTVILPRHLHRAVLGLLRPAEAAARRLIIVAARGLVVAPLSPRKPKARPVIPNKAGRAGQPTPAESLASRVPALPLFDPLPPWSSRRRSIARGVPRISVPGFSGPFPIPAPPSPDDPVNAARLALRLGTLASALDDLPAQARRFARWRARRAASAQNRDRIRRVWPLRPGRPPGQRPAKRRRHEVYEILHDLHGLAFDVLEQPDTS